MSHNAINSHISRKKCEILGKIFNSVMIVIRLVHQLNPVYGMTWFHIGTLRVKIM